MNADTLKELLANAAPGPWKADESPVFGDYYVRNDPVNWNGQGYRWIANVNGGCGRGEAELIALAPQLAAEVIKLRELVERLREALLPFAEDEGMCGVNSDYAAARDTLNT